MKNIHKEENDFARMNGVKLPLTTGEPESIQAPLSVYEENAPEEFVSKKQTWEQPWPKAILVGGGLFLVVALLGSMLHGTIQAINSSSTNKNNTPTTNTAINTDSLPDKEEEETTGEMKTKLALTTQLNQLSYLKNKSTATPKPSVVASPPRTLPQTRSSSYEASPPPSYRPAPQPAAVIRPVPRAIAPVTPATPSNPYEAWENAGNIGSWGGVTVASTSTPTPTPVPTAVATADLPRGGLGAAPTSVSSSSSSSMPNILAGTRVKGTMIHPVTWSDNVKAAQTASIKLSKDLRDRHNKIVVPKGSIILAKVNQTSDSGLVMMSATAAQIYQGDVTIEKQLPEGSLMILGGGGGVLQAKMRYPDPWRQNTTTTAAFAGIAKAAEIANRPESQSSFSNNGGNYQSSYTSSRANSFVGAFEGVASSLAAQSQLGMQQKMRRLDSQKSFFLIDTGTSVQVLVKNSFSL